ncbi:MAG: 1,4-dihydroxy-2-naphthoate octaprenyltransferase [Paludibacteraceae bacterium]|nr:1,4-dihydroxy-2-naphthoate octaprenyltransferase [Paludibacteraceae bacterium]
MNKYIASLRLRTLPLSMSGIILGSGLAYHYQQTLFGFHIDSFDWYVFAWAILTTLSLQILSNLSNEYGDAQRGTDSEQQGRAAYGMQAGTITAQEMRRMIVLFVFLSMVFGGVLVLTAFDTFQCVPAVVFLGLGALAIVGAMTYTLGKHNYGYKGLGDLGVFLFFGLLSTLGSFYLQTQTLTAEAVLAAVAIALPNVGVLNLNNVRDMDNDLKHGKRTLASRLGKKGGKIYHALLLLICYVLFVCIGKYWVLCTLPVIIWHVWYIFRHDGHALDLQMPVLMFTTLTIALLAIV